MKNKEIVEAKEKALEDAKKLKEKSLEDAKKLKEKSKGFMGEFKTFIARGNVVDLAVGVVIGTAFGNIVNSLVNDIIMPLVGLAIGGHDFTKLTITVKDASINYGLFIQNIVDFLIIALCIFIVVKTINKFFMKKKKEETKVEEAPKKSEEVILLEQIRDLLKK